MISGIRRAYAIYRELREIRDSITDEMAEDMIRFVERLSSTDISLLLKQLDRAIEAMQRSRQRGFRNGEVETQGSTIDHAGQEERTSGQGKSNPGTS